MGWTATSWLWETSASLWPTKMSLWGLLRSSVSSSNNSSSSNNNNNNNNNNNSILTLLPGCLGNPAKILTPETAKNTIPEGARDKRRWARAMDRFRATDLAGAVQAMQAAGATAGGWTCPSCRKRAESLVLWPTLKAQKVRHRQHSFLPAVAPPRHRMVDRRENDAGPRRSRTLRKRRWSLRSKIRTQVKTSEEVYRTGSGDKQKKGVKCDYLATEESDTVQWSTINGALCCVDWINTCARELTHTDAWYESLINQSALENLHIISSGLSVTRPNLLCHILILDWRDMCVLWFGLKRSVFKAHQHLYTTVSL